MRGKIKEGGGGLSPLKTKLAGLLRQPQALPLKLNGVESKCRLEGERKKIIRRIHSSVRLSYHKEKQKGRETLKGLFGVDMKTRGHVIRSLGKKRKESKDPQSIGLAVKVLV